ncbi:MAG: transporter substrate-binding domain-containing protein [Gammaproteobacteria bacterium]|nr:transporter substrate-binding domain-containing protein [Gammaproteobacteria bacterium]
MKNLRLLVVMRKSRIDQTWPFYSLIMVASALFTLVYAPISAAFFNTNHITLEESLSLRGDFDNILRLGRLRILLPQDFTSITYLPRRRSPLAEQQRIAEAFAESHGLKPELVFVKSFAELIPALQAGKGDIIINNLTINDQRLKKISFSVPVDHVREQIIVRSDDKRITRVRDLDAKTVMVNRDSTFWHALQWLKENKYPDINLLAAPDHVKREQILDLLARGEIDATILDSNLMEIFQAYRGDIKVAANFSGQRDIAWGIRKDAPRLVSEINRFLQFEYSSNQSDEVYTDDFDKIKQRKVLRVLLRNNAASYFLYRGELQGFEYELIKEFARYHDLRLQVLVPPSHERFSTWLLEGKADIAMGFLEIDNAKRLLGISYSQPYHYARRHIVVAADSDVSQISDFNNQLIMIKRRTSYWEALLALQRQGAGFQLRAANDKAEIEQLMSQVADGKLEATVADEQILDIGLAKGLKVKSGFILADQVPNAIALRGRNQQLKATLDRFIKRIYKSEFYNVLYSKYFKSRKSVVKLARGRVVDTLNGQISPFDNLVQKYADKYGFDWRLITAQMFQESGFNPDAKSPIGARGLMQLMPRTAHSMGVRKIDDPDDSILGGVKYMDWLRDRFDNELPIAERLWFSLAAYNAGVGHVHDARRLARNLGHDPDRWFENTEQAMLLLSKKKYAKKARYGFVNGKEPVNYVRQIKDRFEAYVELSGSLLGGQPDQLINIVGRAAPGQIVSGFGKPLQDRPDSLAAAETFGKFITDIASIEIGKYQYIGITPGL